MVWLKDRPSGHRSRKLARHCVGRRSWNLDNNQRPHGSGLQGAARNVRTLPLSVPGRQHRQHLLDLALDSFSDSCTSFGRIFANRGIADDTWPF